MAPPIEEQHKELPGVTRVSETTLRREVDLDLLHNRINTDSPLPRQQASYAVYILSDMRELPRGRYTLWDHNDFEGWTAYDFNNLTRAIRQEHELLLALAEHGHYPGGRWNCTQAEKLGDIINRRSTEYRHLCSPSRTQKLRRLDWGGLALFTAR